MNLFTLILMTELFVFKHRINYYQSNIYIRDINMPYYDDILYIYMSYYHTIPKYTMYAYCRFEKINSSNRHILYTYYVTNNYWIGFGKSIIRMGLYSNCCDHHLHINIIAYKDIIYTIYFNSTDFVHFDLYGNIIKLHQTSKFNKTIEELKKIAYEIQEKI